MASKQCLDDTWVAYLSENLLRKMEEYQNSHDGVIVSVSQVPTSLKSSNPEAFIPQFVGLGPYHHDKSLIMDDDLKLDSSIRALKHFFHHLDTKTQQRLKFILSHSRIQAFYHNDDVCSKYNHQKLLYILTVDCLFLLGLLHRASTTEPQQEHYCFLTGKQGIAMVNSAGVEMTMDSIMRDIFTLENQIPTYFLKQVEEAVIITTNNRKNIDGIESSQEEEAYLGLRSTMKKLCQTLCPFVHEFELSKNPEDHHHLLDLMYHLIVPDDTDPDLPRKPESKPPSQDADHPEDHDHDTDPDLPRKPESKPPSQDVDHPEDYDHPEPLPQHVDHHEDHDHLSDLMHPLIEPDHIDVVIDQEPELKPKPDDKTQVNTCFFVCRELFRYLSMCVVFVAVLLYYLLWFVVMFFRYLLVSIMLACVLIYFTIRFVILPTISSMLEKLFSFIMRARHSLLKLFESINPYVGTLYDSLSNNENNIPFLKPWTKVVGAIKKTGESITKEEDYLTHWDNNTMVTIPSVTELHNAGIKFQPSDKVKNGISSIAFDEIKCQFCLPVIKLDVHSEVIIRNLMAYELLIKPNELIFTRYVELMGAIIDTSEDVKLLVNEKIIETELSYEVVTQLFNGMMGKSIKPTKVQNLDEVIKKVNAKFKSIQAKKMALVKYISAFGQSLTVFAAIVFLVLTAVQTYCSAFGCARN